MIPKKKLGKMRGYKMSDNISQDTVNIIVSKIDEDIKRYLMIAMLDIESISHDFGLSGYLPFVPEDIIHDLMMDVSRALTKDYMK